MNKFIFAFLVISVAAVAVPPSSVPSFAEKIALPPLSLADAARGGPLSVWNAGARANSGAVHHVTLPEKRVSHMPIAVPPEGLDQKMIVAPADSATDFKLIVKSPEMESAKAAGQ